MRDRFEVGAGPGRNLFVGSELGRKGADARQRGLQVVRHAAKEIGLDGRQPIQLIRLSADLCVEERVFQGRRRVLADEGQQIDLRRRRLDAALPGAYRMARRRSPTATSMTANAPMDPRSDRL